MPHLISNGQPIDFEDTITAATFIKKRGDALLIKNINNFSRIPEKVIDVEEFFKR
jgi:predicted nucleic acid-binding protein